MNFKDENGAIIQNWCLEKTEQDQAEKYITDKSVVLELGARYGTVSCIINKKIAVTTNQVSVEPDTRVHEVLENNMRENGCNFHIVKGIVSKSSCHLDKLDTGYGTISVSDTNGSVPHFTLEEIEANYNLKFNTLVADCEGFLEQFFDENPHMYQQLDLILFECDYPERCNYKKIIMNLFDNSFERLENGFHQVWRKSNESVE